MKETRLLSNIISKLQIRIFLLQLITWNGIVSLFVFRVTQKNIATWPMIDLIPHLQRLENDNSILKKADYFSSSQLSHSGRGPIIFISHVILLISKITPETYLVTQAKNQYPLFTFIEGDLRLIKDQIEGCIFYIDVLEHIEDDANELSKVVELLAPGSLFYLVVPAHNFFFSEFDRQVGHYRRYRKKDILAILPPELSIVRVQYLDSIGFLALLVNRFLRKTSLPTIREIVMSDNLIPVSRLLDTITFHRLGKSLILVAKKINMNLNKKTLVAFLSLSVLNFVSRQAKMRAKGFH